MKLKTCVEPGCLDTYDAKESPWIHNHRCVMHRGDVEARVRYRRELLDRDAQDRAARRREMLRSFRPRTIQ